MAVPKKKTSKTRTKTRRAHLALKPITLSRCLHCQKPQKPHHVCLNCGYYNGKEVIKIKSKIKRKNKVVKKER